MNLSNPRSLASANAAIISIFYIIVFVSVNLFLGYPMEWLLLGITTIIMAIFTYFFFKTTSEKFIYNKIKLIYKSIHSLKLSDKEKVKIEKPSKQTIENVNKEVMLWAQQKRDEIEQLKRMQNYRQEFLGNVSHELKTPIFNIQGYILTLLDGGMDDPEINRKYLLRSEKSINRMIAIIEDLEAISKLESGELKTEIKKIDIVAITKEIIDFIEFKAKKKNIQIHFAKNYEKPIYILADKESIRQIMTNLIDNSIKYGKENGSTKISFFDMDENVLIEVTDNGIGVEKENIPRLFERFYRVDKSRSREQGGSGLGLSIVKHLIEAHNQTINVRSTPGIGTTFAFTMKKG